MKRNNHCIPPIKLLDPMERGLRPELVDEFRKIYPDKKSAINEHVRKVKEILEDATKSGAFRAIPITTRMKEFDSALNSLRRRQAARFEREELRKRVSDGGGNWELYWKRRGKEQRINDCGPFEDVDSMLNALHDFGGARVCVYFPDDVENVISFLNRSELIKVIHINRKTQGATDMDELREYVEMLEQQSSSPSDKTYQKPEEKSVTSGRLFPGYRATHLVVELLGDAVPEWHRGSHYRVEIQIGTVVMHAWSQIEHDIIYKSGGNEPSDEERGILDLFNGIVIAGEAALKQLAACTARKEKDRSRDDSAAATNRYELGAWLAAYCDEYSLRPGGAATPPAWNELDKLLDILRSSGEHTSGKLRELLQKVRETSQLDSDAFGDDLPLYLLKAKFDLATKTTPRFSSEAIQDRKQKTAAEARYLASQVVHSISMASYLGFMDEFLDSIESALPNPSELPRPAVIDFIELLHPQYPRLNREAEDRIIEFCEAFLDVKNLQKVVKRRKTLLKMELPLLLTDIGRVVSPINNIKPTQDEVLTIVPRSLYRILHDPDQTFMVPEILICVELITSFSHGLNPKEEYQRLRIIWREFTVVQSSPFIIVSICRDSKYENVEYNPNIIHGRMRMQQFSGNLKDHPGSQLHSLDNSWWDLVFERSLFAKETSRPLTSALISTATLSHNGVCNDIISIEAGCFEPVWSDTPTWRYVRRQPTQWTVRTVDLSKHSSRQNIEKVARKSQWADLAKYLKPEYYIALEDCNEPSQKKYTIKVGEFHFTIESRGDKFHFLYESRPLKSDITDRLPLPTEI